MANHGGAMRLAAAIIGFFMLVAGPVAAAMPDPPPPEGFAAGQYIDGSGCVFLRDNDGWQARRDRDGAQICGFPPTLSQRGLAQPPGIAERLAARIAEGPDVEADPDPEPYPALRSPLEQDLQALIFQQDGMRAAMMGMHDRNLCGLLGYSPAPDGIAVLGQDVTYGRCAGMIATVPGHVVTPGARHRAVPSAGSPGDSTPIEEADPAEAALAQPAPAAEPTAAEPDVAEPAKAEPVPAPPLAQAQPAPAMRSAPQASERVEMIPAHARYIRIGRYPDRAAALPLAHELVSRGYAAGLARAPDQPQAMLLLVGPFGTRAALVRALNELRADGHADAVAY